LEGEALEAINKIDKKCISELEKDKLNLQSESYK